MGRSLSKIERQDRVKKQNWIAVSLVAALLLVVVPSALAVPPLPSSFYGVVKVNGANVPVGTKITAWINHVKYAETAVFVYGADTVYRLDVPGDDNDTPGKQGGVQGDTIVFFIGQHEAQPAAPWKSGVNAHLDLTLKPGGETLQYLVYLPFLKK